MNLTPEIVTAAERLADEIATDLAASANRAWRPRRRRR
jgi:hypothetical protein